MWPKTSHVLWHQSGGITPADSSREDSTFISHHAHTTSQTQWPRNPLVCCLKYSNPFHWWVFALLFSIQLLLSFVFFTGIDFSDHLFYVIVTSILLFCLLYVISMNEMKGRVNGGCFQIIKSRRASPFCTWNLLISWDQLLELYVASAD